MEPASTYARCLATAKGAMLLLIAAASGPDPSRDRREAAWKAAELVADGPELSLDDRIRETVLGLWANGVMTAGSCEGHDGASWTCPWIDISPPGFYPRLHRLAPDGDNEARRVLFSGYWAASGEAKALVAAFSEGRDATAAGLRVDLAMLMSRAQALGAEAPTDSNLIEACRAEMAAFGAWLHRRFLQPPSAYAEAGGS